MIKRNDSGAREVFQAALDIDPELAGAYGGLAQTYAR
jgi:hypothetical protein